MNSKEILDNIRAKIESGELELSELQTLSIYNLNHRLNHLNQIYNKGIGDCIEAIEAARNKDYCFDAWVLKKISERLEKLKK